MPSDPESSRGELHALLLDRAFTFGDFVLSSGRHSNFYFDGRQVTLHPRGLLLISQLVLQRCRKLRVDAIGGLTLGADPIVAGVIALSASDGGPTVEGFLVRQGAKTHGTGKLVEGPTLQDGRRVALVDDTTTTGSSYLTAAAAVRPLGVTIVEAIAVVDREEGAREVLQREGIALYSLFSRNEFMGS